MRKQVTTRWYIVAWLVQMLALIVFFDTSQLRPASTYWAEIGTSAASTAPWVLLALAGLVMLAMWMGALVALGRAREWGWFGAVMVLQLVGLGIAGMAAYAIAGPPDLAVETPVRPSFT